MDHIYEKLLIKTCLLTFLMFIGEESDHREVFPGLLRGFQG